ncbi:MAG: lactonase family protein [bacterium]
MGEHIYLYRRLLVGAYGPPEGSAKGFTVLGHDSSSGTLRTLGAGPELNSPSFLAFSPDAAVVYATSEQSDGRVSAFRWRRSDVPADPGSFTALGEASTGGEAPCHVAVHPSGRFLFSANYSSGSVAVHRLSDDGGIGELTDLAEVSGSGPDPDRQVAPHAHMVAVAPAGHEIAVADLGSDRVWRFGLDRGSGRLSALDPPLVLPPGSGTRQVLFVDDGRRVVTLGELDGSVAVADWPPRTDATVVSTPGATTDLAPGGLAAALVTADGRRFYCSHRGADRIAVLDRQADAVKVVAEFDCAGAWPRHLSLAGDVLYVANQHSNAVAAIGLRADGRTPSSVTTATLPSPTCVLLEPRKDGPSV